MLLRLSNSAFRLVFVSLIFVFTQWPANAQVLHDKISGPPPVNPNGGTAYIATADLDPFWGSLTYPKTNATSGFAIVRGIQATFGPVLGSGTPPAGQLVYTDMRSYFTGFPENVSLQRCKLRG
ncbi:MAG TPA: hypothetical protein VME66_08675 [Candidatus Acidoferrales bacterium]|nr:hypothetical protein [Candidatus Acidoferrales bacterium]